MQNKSLFQKSVAIYVVILSTPCWAQRYGAPARFTVWMRPRRGVRSESSALAVKAPLSRRTPKLRSPARRVGVSRTALSMSSEAKNLAV